MPVVLWTSQNAMKVSIELLLHLESIILLILFILDGLDINYACSILSNLQLVLLLHSKLAFHFFRVCMSLRIASSPNAENSACTLFTARILHFIQKPASQPCL